jgi:hypothetical protein
MSKTTTADTIFERIHAGELMMVNDRRRNGLIICKTYYAEFAGPGAAVGGEFDLDCDHIIPVGDLSMLVPKNHDDRQRAFKIRRQWIKLTQQFTDHSEPAQRARMILNQFENYFDQSMISKIPDDAFSLLVGVLPYTIRQARRTPVDVNVKVKRS